MKPFIGFKYEPGKYIEDKSLREFNEAHDIHSPMLAWQIIGLLAGSLIFAIAIICLVIMNQKLIIAILGDIPVWLWTIFTMAFVAGVLIIRSARKSEV